MPGNRQVALGVRSRLVVFLTVEKDAREAALVAALTQEGERLLQPEFTRLLGDPLICFAKDILGQHYSKPVSVTVSKNVPHSDGAEPCHAGHDRHNAPVGEREKRLARNETLYREVNERVSEVAEKLLDTQLEMPVGFICECAASDCTEPITATLGEYEAIRAEPTRFIVVPGHERPEIESVVERRPAYFVVEKREEEAEEVARETDPRA